MNREYKKLNDVEIFRSKTNKIKAMNTYFKYGNHKMRKKYKNIPTLTSVLESVDTAIFIGATTTSVRLSITDGSLIVVPKFAGVACALSFRKKKLYKSF